MQKDFKFNAEALERLINQYFIECDERERWYSEAGLCAYIGLPLARYRKYMKASETYLATQDKKTAREEIGDESIQYGHLEVLARGALRIAEQLSQRTDKMALAQVKQLHLGGYDEKATAKAKANDEPVKIEVSLKGAGGDPFG